LKIATGDLEADGLLDTATRVWCGVFKENDGSVHKFLPDQIPEMLKYMDTIDVLKMHNGIGYDWPLLKKLYGYVYRGKKVDTLIMSRLLNPKRTVPPHCPDKGIGPHSVEAWGYRVGRGKPSHEDWSRFSEDMLFRCTEDVLIQESIYDALIEESKTGNWRNAFLLTFELFENLQLQEEYGWLVDQDHMTRCIRVLDRYIRWIDRAVIPQLPYVLEVEETKEKGEYKYVKKPFLKSGNYSESVTSWCARSGIDVSTQPVGGVFTRVSFRLTDLNSGDEVKEFLLASGWEPLEWNENDSGERTSPKLSKDDPFEGIEGTVGTLVAKRVQCRHRRSTIEGLLKLVRPDGRIPSVVNNLAVTARATHRNIVNIPKAGSFFGKHMRRIFTSKPGYVLVGTDSAGNQLRQLAARMNNPEFIFAMTSGKKEDGTDPHTLTQRAGDLESRDIAKNTIYCLLFGGGDSKLAKTAKKPIGSGADLRNRLYRGLDGLGELVEKLVREWRLTARQRYNPKFNRMEYFDGTITGLDGRPIKVPFEHQLLVYLLQSDESIMMSKAYNIMCANLNKKYRWGIDYGVVAWYHDEYTVECREEIAEDVKLISEEAIAEAGRFFNITCPHLGQGAIGRNWYDIH
jgi:DNA polymerase I